MKKLGALFLLLCVVLFGCSSSPKTTSFPDTPFKDGQYTVSGNHGFTRLSIENGTLYLTFDWEKHDTPLFSDFSQGRFLTEPLPTYEKETAKSEVRWYRNGIKGYNSRYGKDYFVFLNPTITKVTGKSNTWVIRIDERDALFFDVKDDGTFTDQYGHLYQK